ncbi:MAG: GNAT family N-acetyltransferase, partial [Gammaproteobacteria bacterium]
GFMYVSTHYRRQGINKHILNRLVDWSHEKGVKDIYLEVYAKNVSAVQAYEKAGFEACVIEMKLDNTQNEGDVT